MKHAIGYLGHYDRSFQSLHPNPREYVREDGSIGRVDERPTDVNGVFFGYMERQGKTFGLCLPHHSLSSNAEDGGSVRQSNR